MTKLEPITRVVVLKLDNRVAPRPQDEVAVTLHPGGTISFRPCGRRKAVSLPLDLVYALAVKADAKGSSGKG